MGTRRSCLGVAVLHGLLYAAGGYDGASCLNRYIQTNFLVMNAEDLIHLSWICYIVASCFSLMLFPRPDIKDCLLKRADFLCHYIQGVRGV